MGGNSAHSVSSVCSILVGQIEQASKAGNNIMITEERQQLFYKKDNLGQDAADENGAGDFEGYGGDLAKANLNRGRDHNLSTWYAYAKHFFYTGFGNGHVANFNNPRHIGQYCMADAGCHNSGDIRSLDTAYGRGRHNTYKVDLWIGALSEPKINNTGGTHSMLGSVLTKDVVTQFRDLRDGDRFFYQNYSSNNALGWPSANWGPGLSWQVSGAVRKGLRGWMNDLTGSNCNWSSTSWSNPKRYNPFGLGSLTCSCTQQSNGQGGGAITANGNEFMLAPTGEQICGALAS